MQKSGGLEDFEIFFFLSTYFSHLHSDQVIHIVSTGHVTGYDIM